MSKFVKLLSIGAFILFTVGCAATPPPVAKGEWVYLKNTVKDVRH